MLWPLPSSKRRAAFSDLRGASMPRLMITLQPKASAPSR